LVGRGCTGRRDDRAHGRVHRRVTGRLHRGRLARRRGRRRSGRRGGRRGGRRRRGLRREPGEGRLLRRARHGRRVGHDASGGVCGDAFFTGRTAFFTAFL